MKKKVKLPTPTKRGASFVLGLGTKVIPDKKKQKNKYACR